MVYILQHGLTLQLVTSAVAFAIKVMSYHNRFHILLLTVLSLVHSLF